MEKIKYLIVTLLILGISCTSNKLTNEGAFEILQAEYSNNCTAYVSNWTGSSHKDYDSKIAVFNSLEEKGHATITSKYIRGYFGIKGFTQYKLEFTDSFNHVMKGHNREGYYYVTETITHEILGIQHNNDDNTALVRFAYTLVPNELYDLKGSDEKCRGSIGLVKETEARFIKYDTGWQMEK